MRPRFQRDVEIRGKVGRMRVACLTICCALVAWMGVVSADTAPKPAEAAAVVVAPELRLWVEQSESTTSPLASLAVTVPQGQTLDTPVTFKVSVDASHDVYKMHVALRISSSAGVPLYDASLEMPLAKGENPCEMLWKPSALAPGDYRAELALQRRSDEQDARLVLRLRVLDRAAVQAEVDSAAARAAELAAAVSGLLPDSPARAYGDLKAATAHDTAKLAARRMNEIRWNEAADLAAFVSAVHDAWRARQVFAETAKSDEPPCKLQTNLSQVEVANGGFVAEGHPVFLFGEYLGADAKADAERLSRYRLNLLSASFPGPSADSALRVQESDPGAWGLLLNLAPSDGEARTLNYAAAIKVLRTRLAAVHSIVGERSAAARFAVLEPPRILPLAEEDRLAFIESLQEFYKDRNTLNQTWRTHFREFSDVSIDWGISKKTYAYDLRSFHLNQTAAVYEKVMLDASRTAGIPCGIEMPDTLLSVDDVLSGIDPERLGGLGIVYAVRSTVTLAHPRYAVGYPMPGVLFALHRSLSPDSALIASQWTVDGDLAVPTVRTARQVAATLWETVLEGANGVALSRTEEGRALLEHPIFADGFSATALDIRRLAPVVAALQRRPAEVGILWTPTSRIFDGGDPYLASLRDAYEGAGFAGFSVRFVTAAQCRAGALNQLKVLVIPDAPAMDDETFTAIQSYIREGGAVVRTESPGIYNERGGARRDLFEYTAHTVLVRGDSLPVKYMHALDAAYEFGSLPPVPRAVNSDGYPIEGLRTRYAVYEGKPCLYLLNLRKEPVSVSLFGEYSKGRDLISGREVSFPTRIDSLEPLLILLEGAPIPENAPSAVQSIIHQAPVVELQPVPEPVKPGPRAPQHGPGR